MADAKTAPKIDKQAPAPHQSVAVVQASAFLQSQAGRINRLRALARTNKDVAWLIDLAGPRFGEISRPKAVKQSRAVKAENAGSKPVGTADAEDVSVEFKVPTGVRGHKV